MSKLPEKWKILSIGDFAKTSAGGTPSTQIQEYWEGGDIPWMSSGEVHKKRVFAVDGRITQSGYGNSSAKLFPPKTILMALAGQGKTRGTVAISEIELTTNQSIAGISVTAKNVSPDFVYHNLDSRYDELRGVSGGSGRAGLNLTIINEQELLIPPLPEQKKIAAILTSVDDVIEKTQAQIDKLKDLKTGMMQELLTRGVGVDGKPHTEFKDSPVGRIPKGWDVVALSQSLSKIDSGWSPACVETPPATGEWGVIKVSAVTRGRFLEQESKTLPNNLEPKPHAQIKRGDILLTRANGVADLVGKCVMVHETPKANLMMSDKILRLNYNDRIHSTYLLHYFNSRQVRKQIELSWGGSSGQKNISQADIKGYFIALPPLNEQIVIGDSISKIDTLLSVKEAKLRKLEDLKKALMQDLLTGKVRVKVDS
ncbi:hypothetical protein BCV39_08650 [Vibrio sp. 10N.286.55.E10]|uniref:restriction endonuclease subunit S n=1 Tax=unclassified Vibrio TaxID=2614977 RepID=UPI000C821CA6|nr:MULTISPECIES: restriction endonuclease subunit S [unclassified Vibrio]PME29181.1 hypothetical protein BCV39_08650 [Vibrio sp. 10N.286.55.E10]PME38756.1 hypothetical protein BCV40_00895 [Vibrio sp. 10N.286.55.E12]PME61153.1 hypothetical protein BCV32_05760 [Vibrio sp. 10N.286.55.C11]